MIDLSPAFQAPSYHAKGDRALAELPAQAFLISQPDYIFAAYGIKLNLKEMVGDQNRTARQVSVRHLMTIYIDEAASVTW